MRKGKKALIIMLSILGGITVILYLLFPAVMGIVASTRGAAGKGEPPDGFEAVTLTAQDSVQLSAWYAPPQNGACILLLHGAHSSKEEAAGYARMLQKHGYGVLALDVRGHGGSGGGNALGWECGKDISAALDYLKSQGSTEPVGALGLSMGGEILLGESSAFPEITAIISDGATHHSIGDYLSLPENRSLWRSWTTRVMYFTAGVFTGQQPPQTTIQDSMTEAADTRYLLIAAGEEADEQAFGALYADAAAGRTDLWTVPDAGHTQALSLVPEEYEQRITEFFDAALLVFDDSFISMVIFQMESELRKQL